MKPTFGIREGLSARREVRREKRQHTHEFEGRLVSDTILMACNLAYGERCDVKKNTNDVLGSRLNNFFIAMNDWIDVGRKLENSDEKTMLKSVYDNATQQLDTYFNEDVDDEQERKRREKLRQLFESVRSEVVFLETDLDELPENDIDAYNKIKKYKELINGIETVLNIQVCVDEDMFDRRFAEDADTSFDSLSKKYRWLVDTEFDDQALNDDEKNARMLYFAAMSAQMANDRHRYKVDRSFDIWKPMTYLTERMGYNDEEAQKIIMAEEQDYTELAERYGLSQRVTKLSNRATGVALDLANIAVGLTHSKLIGNNILQRLIKKNAWRQVVESTYPKDHPDFEIH